MDEGEIKILWDSLRPCLNEKMRRLLAAGLSEAHGRGGDAMVRRATGISLNTITAGKRDLADIKDDPSGFDPKIRRPGGGNKTKA
ncbi:MAG: ISAzo13 family transposase, partial [Deltaproteobacteria bacterium]|nr:ISAzo13 family transposase [Deltaproteobacteria bacterium]